MPLNSYFAETERDFISIRTKQGLAAAKANGVELGRPKGSKNKERVLDPYRGQIKRYLEMGLNLTSIQTIINHQLKQPISYTSYRYFVQHDRELWPLWQAQKDKPVGRTVMS